MNLKDILAPVFKWWWLLVVACIITTGTAVWAVREIPPIYMARTTLMIGRAIMNPNPSSYEFALSQNLVSAYADVVYREPIAEATKATLGLTELPKYEARPITGSPFLEIRVTSTNPGLAQVVASELSNQLIKQSPTNVSSDTGDNQAFLSQQLSDIKDNIRQTQLDIAQKQGELARLESAVDIAKTQSEINALETKLTSLQGIYSNLLASNPTQAVNTLSIFEPAALPTRPIGPNKILIILLAAVSGIVLATGAAYIIEFLDDTLKTAEDVTKLMQLPILGYIGKIPKGKAAPYISEQPRSPTAEAFRALRASLDFAVADWPLKTILVSSVEPMAGKTSIAANLAMTIAQGGKKVLLVDADLRKPNVHKTLGINNGLGVSDIITGQADIDSASHVWLNENLKVLTAGTMHSSPTELIGSDKMAKFLDLVDQYAEVVIVDGPPFILADASILASKVDGVLFVVRSGHTRKEHARVVLDQVRRIGLRVIGIVLNMTARNASYYTSYHYYSHYYSGNGHSTDSHATKVPWFKIPSKKKPQEVEPTPKDS